MALPAQAYLHQCLQYDMDTGALTWKSRPEYHFKSAHDAAVWNKRYAGKPAIASMTKAGYLQGSLNNKHVKAHRVIYKMLHGWEPEHIDHDDHNRSNNTPDNLKDSDQLRNSQNKSKSSRNASGHTGVRWDRGAWSAQLANKYIGRYPTFELAVSAYETAKEQAGYHSNHGV